jgi:prephenate dehydratase
MKVGYLGPGKATFGFMAAEKFFAGEDDVEFVALRNHTEICRATGEEEIDFGVVAVENVIEGVVTETIYATDRFSRSDRLLVSGEVEIPIELFLFRKTDDGNAPAKLLGHLMSLRQCSKKVATFQSLHGNIPAETVESNGKAAELAAKDSSCVAIGTAKAEQEYELVRLEPGSITNNPNNFTRFWIVGTKKAKTSERDKTCLLVNFDQPVPGGICKALLPFASRGINLLLIAPIPIPGRKWEYSFMVEFTGSWRDQKMKDAYEELCASGVSMDAPIVLGSYPAGT